MKTLFYNSIELPAEVHIVSECFGIDITYEPMGDPDHPAWMILLRVINAYIRINAGIKNIVNLKGRKLRYNSFFIERNSFLWYNVVNEIF